MRPGTAQSFLESVNNATAASWDEPEYGVEDPSSAGSCECCCRCGRVAKRKPFGPRGRRSKSYTALRTGISELSGWEWEPPKVVEPVVLKTAKSYEPGEAPLERLPMEILGMFK